MTTDALNQLTTRALDDLATALDAGHSDALAHLLRTCSRFHRYSLSNVCLIATQRPTATQVAGYGTWKALHRYVRRGERGIAILAPIIREREDEAGERWRAIVGFRTAYVFDVAQTDGEPLPEIASAAGDPGEFTTRLTAAITASGVQVEYADVLGGALGMSLGGRIAVQRALPPATELLVLAHEWAHELLHRGEERPASRDIRELEAQAVSFVVCEAVGLESLAATVDYIHLYRGDRQALAASLDRIQRTATRIIRALEVSR
jgi:hypothetical protein